MTETFTLPCIGSNPRAQRAAAAFPAQLLEVHEGRIVLRETAVYHTNRTHLDVACTVCGHKWKSTPHNLTVCKKSCPECAHQKQKEKAGKVQCRRASKAEKELARRCRKAGMNLDAIAFLMNRAKSAIAKWCDPKQLEKSRNTAKRNNAKRMANGQQQKVCKAYSKTPQGKASYAKASHQRRALTYHCVDTILVDGVWHEVDMYDYVTTAEDRKFWSFPGADDDVAKRKVQQQKLEKISGEPYSLEHLVPLSRGGIHHPDNFANRAWELNNKKKNSIWSSDVELFCRRLFNIN